MRVITISRLVWPLFEWVEPIYRAPWVGPYNAVGLSEFLTDHGWSGSMQEFKNPVLERIGGNIHRMSYEKDGHPHVLIVHIEEITNGDKSAQAVGHPAV